MRVTRLAGLLIRDGGHRYALVTGSALFLAVAIVLFALFWHAKPDSPALTVVPIEGCPGQLVVAVTNNTKTPLSGRLRVSVEDYPVGPDGRAAPEVETAMADHVTLFGLGPRSGKVCTVQYNPRYRRFVFSAEYTKSRGVLESKMQALLYRLHVPGVTTNDVWHTLRIGRIVQQ